MKNRVPDSTVKIIADLHIHSHRSVATSKNLVPEHIEYWAGMKGIDLVGTGDCLHPGWLAELEEKLEPVEGGLFALKQSFRLDESGRARGMNHGGARFVLSGEISTIYKRDGKVRKVHHLCLFPDLVSARTMQSKLERVGNISSDGRPILGLDSRLLLEMLLDSSPRAVLIPAHIWTPWFSVLGSMSGFDRIEECYGDLSGEIFAVESGLSADPAMIRICSFLDRYTVISNSDAHSPEKLGREANVLDCDMTYDSLRAALGSGDISTIEFFPEEGKYHYDGHRKCGVRMDPLETVRNGGVCPVCGKAVTRGVMYRVAELADRDPGAGNIPPFRSITALPDLIAEIKRQKSATTKTVREEYMRLIATLGPEFHILLDASPDEIAEAGGELLSEGITRLRKGRVIIDEGYDGEFGRIRVFDESELSAPGRSLFGQIPAAASRPEERISVRFSIEQFRELKAFGVGQTPVAPERARVAHHAEPGFGQAEAVAHDGGPCMVIAGPGSGKTWVLVERMVNLVRGNGADPGSMVALTFSSRAAKEIAERLGAHGVGDGIVATTFHSFGLSIIAPNCARLGRREGFSIIGPAERETLLARIGVSTGDISRISAAIEAFKEGSGGREAAGEWLDRYRGALVEENAFDLPDLVVSAADLLEGNPDLREEYAARCKHLLVDEFQDINPSQYRLLRLLAPAEQADLFIIGDPDQAIYGFRGASARYFEQVKTDYPAVKMITLERSYRCPDPVIRAAVQALGRKSFMAGTPSKMKVRISRFPTDRSEAEWIARTIEAAMGGVRSFSMDSGMADGTPTDASFSDFAVLCRSSFMFAPVIEALANHGISYQVAGREPFVRMEPYRGVCAVLESVYRARPAAGISEGLREDIQGMMSTRDEVADVIRFLMHIRDDGIEERERLASFAREYGSDWGAFFRAVALRSPSDDIDPRGQSVKVMTIHASKGLEFRRVFVPGCEDGIIPMTMFGPIDDEAMREEERLFYVAATRTGNELFLSHAESRTYRGRVLRSGRSPFLDRIEKDLAYFAETDKKKKAEEEQLELFGR